MSTAPAPYRHIANDFTDKIKSGELPPGAKLPSTREIADIYGVSMVTVSRAVSLLHDRDLVIGHPGRGVFVAGEPEDG
ncbi:MAG: winged helix-turn-helix transcriptional regulator [Dactylosporangium sp.]|nr:winged helix-turn-helix domain-containing protein [Dactylosporangium sp.]NNJ62593.1 winged helix-turn-helix transcriptional regulator [Dactylosporangium sp.]